MIPKELIRRIIKQNGAGKPGYRAVRSMLALTDSMTTEIAKIAQQLTIDRGKKVVTDKEIETVYNTWNGRVSHV